MTKFGGQFALASPLQILGRLVPQPLVIYVHGRRGDYRFAGKNFSRKTKTSRLWPGGLVNLYTDDTDRDDDGGCSYLALKLVFGKQRRLLSEYTLVGTALLDRLFVKLVEA